MKAKVVAVSPAKTVSIRGTEKVVKRCIVSDGTAQMPLCLWERHIDAVALHSSFAFTNLTTRVFQGKAELTTSHDTSIDAIGDLDVGELEEVQEESGVRIQGVVTGVEVTSGVKCVLCGSWQEEWDGNGRFARCQACKMLQKCQSFTKVLRGTLKVKAEDGTDYTLAIGHSQMTDCLQQRQVVNDKAIEESLLGEETVVFTFDDDCNILSITIPDGELPSCSKSVQ